MRTKEEGRKEETERGETVQFQTGWSETGRVIKHP